VTKPYVPVPDDGRKGGAGFVVVAAPGDVVALDTEVVEAGATVPVPTVPETAVPLLHDARKTLAATTAVSVNPCLIGSHDFTSTPLVRIVPDRRLRTST
jgi:hypothetical protein